VKTEFLRFVLVGGLAAAANWGTGLALAPFMALSIAIVLAYLVGMTVAFVLNRLYVFPASNRPLTEQYARFAMVNAVAFVQVWLVTMGLDKLLFPAIRYTWHAEAVAHAVGVASPIVTSYFGHRRFTFASRREPT
jgi:putative flippase GtrA